MTTPSRLSRALHTEVRKVKYNYYEDLVSQYSAVDDAEISSAFTGQGPSWAFYVKRNKEWLNEAYISLLKQHKKDLVPLDTVG